MSRFLTDKLGTYDLASISAVTVGGGERAVKDGPTVFNAIVRTDGGDAIQTATPYQDAVDAWTAYLDDEHVEHSAPAANVTGSTDHAETSK